ncbi:Clan CA, family C19 [Tritrichomonas foetus]|uniref:Clan CA, family C19 n=1 Tax=Tritrichomonas foetus TaxID=1144522 RepID=A0A1J4K8X7_9EUKA|nr:Clan CA, family C19 [Tritrichomonas foetus]|eukprot:OHT07394.1 Clan CA, family C19 [Tritrichomonas foetus]
MFHGQLRSELRCPKCNTQNFVFDPYLCVTLPLPTERMCTLRYFFVPWDLKQERHFIKIHAISTTELENIKNDAIDRFKIKECVVIYRDDLVGDHGLRLMPALRKIEYFVFEIPDMTKVYSFINVFVEFENKKNTNNLIDGPFLIEVPRTIRNIQKHIEKRLSFYWEETKYPINDACRMLDKRIANEISENLAEHLKDQNQLLYAEPLHPEMRTFDVSEIPQLSTNSIKVTLNPLKSKTSEGFNWPAVMPTDKSCDASKIANEIEMTLAKCFECFSFPDKLDELNEWFCPKCRTLVPAIARLNIWSVPDILILHIKRFIVKDGSFKKIFAKIDFPETIDMAPYVIGPQNKENLTYKLYSVVNHIGTMSGGHYTATSYSDTEKQWYTYNDDAVYQTTQKVTDSETAYVLFYHRINDEKPALSSPSPIRM